MKIFLMKSPIKTKKWRVLFPDGQSVDFGAQGYSDYTLHKDPRRKYLYIQRHEARENWRDMYTPGFWARWLLWEKPSLAQAISFVERKFRVQLVRR